jgi:uncharacterized protein (DUF1800 family)
MKRHRTKQPPNHVPNRVIRHASLAWLGVALLAGCATAPAPTAPATLSMSPQQQLRWVDRVTWGANSRDMQLLSHIGLAAYLDDQLRADPAVALPAAAQSQIAAMQISQTPLPELVAQLDAERKAVDAQTDDEQKKAAHQAYQQHLNLLANESATRSLLRDLYSPKQLQEQMTWFWMNHFSVHKDKHNVRALVADYEDHIRAKSLGRFRDLLAVVVFHPAMLRYLDNEQNALGHINENFARELMELHTLGVDGGYSQRDVQELARILTGVGVNAGPGKPNVRREWQDLYVRRGLFEFNPNRHDFGDKTLLGQGIHGRGLAEVDAALDLLARHPSTARFVSRKLASYFVSDTPPDALVDQMAKRFLATDGNIAEVLHTMIASPAFTASLGSKFKDPTHYVVSAVRLAYDDKIVLNAGPMLNWLNRMGEAPYGHQTPDGYSLTRAAWASPGQMTTRFEIAKAIGSGNAGLFKASGPQPAERAAFPQLANALYYQYWQSLVSPATRAALDAAASPQDWNTYLLASPEFMAR